MGREWEREMRENINGHNEKGTFRINLEQDEQLKISESKNTQGFN